MGDESCEEVLCIVTPRDGAQWTWRGFLEPFFLELVHLHRGHLSYITNWHFFPSDPCYVAAPEMFMSLCLSYLYFDPSTLFSFIHYSVFCTGKFI